MKRRQFLKSALAAGSGLIIIPSGVVSEANAPSNKLNIALIGAYGFIIIFMVMGCKQKQDTSLLHAPPQKNIKLDYDPDNLMLTITHPLLSSKPVQMWCMEAYCKKGSTHRDWGDTVIPQENTLLSKNPYEVILKTVLDNRVEVIHRFAVVSDEILFESTFTNITNTAFDLEWMQPCIRIGNFTGLSQQEYIRKCFIFTEKGLTRLSDTNRTEEAIYKGGQVYVPSGINPEDVNPRPISPDVPANNLIGCFSADETVLLATAWSHVQELFQGVIVCIHADPAIGGLLPKETKHRWGKLYIIPNDSDELLRRYKRDFLK